MRVLFIDSHRSQNSSNELKNNQEFPSGQIQTVGGHSENFSVQDSFLIKRTNRTEGRFYEQLMGKKFGLSEFVPNCVNVEYSPKASNPKIDNQRYSKVTIEDLRLGFKKPVIFDIKLGVRTVSAKELKVAGSARSEILRKDVGLHLADRLTSTAKRGYRFAGSSTSQESRFHLGTHPEQMIEDMAAHLSNKDLSLVLAQLEKMLAYLATQEGQSFEFIGASVLILAESDSDIQDDAQKAQPRVKLIDFAHSSIVGSKDALLDEGAVHSSQRSKAYQKGLRNGLINLVEDLRAVLDQR